jgi:hypothetical protein
LKKLLFGIGLSLLSSCSSNYNLDESRLIYENAKATLSKSCKEIELDREIENFGNIINIKFEKIKFKGFEKLMDHIREEDIKAEFEFKYKNSWDLIENAWELYNFSERPGIGLDVGDGWKFKIGRDRYYYGGLRKNDYLLTDDMDRWNNPSEWVWGIGFEKNF